MNKLDTHDQIQDILHKLRFGIFTSVKNNIPHPTLVAFINMENLSTIVFATTRKSRKFRNLIDNPVVAFFWNTQTNKPDDVNSSVTITAVGVANPLELAEEITRVKKRYLAKHPYMEDFLNDAETAVVAVKISKYELLSDFESISVLEIS